MLDLHRKQRVRERFELNKLRRWCATEDSGTLKHFARALSVTPAQQGFTQESIGLWSFGTRFTGRNESMLSLAELAVLEQQLTYAEQ